MEGTTSNACDTIGYSDRGQTVALRESAISNACDAIGDCQRG